jgi:hypothetical protein
MKTKKFAKKLTLNKNTIANLSNGQLGHVKGGCVDTYPSCPILPISDDCVTLRFTGCAVCPTNTCVTCVSCQTCGGLNTCDFYVQCAEPTVNTI